MTISLISDKLTKLNFEGVDHLMVMDTDKHDDHEPGKHDHGRSKHDDHTHHDVNPHVWLGLTQRDRID